MSQRNTLSLWQKLKQLLTGSAAQADEVEIDMMQIEPHDTYSSDTYNNDAHSSGACDEDTSDAYDDTKIDSESDVKNKSEHSETDAFDSSASQHEASGTPIIDFLKQYFNDKQWRYTHYRPKSSGNKSTDRQQSHHLSLRMRNKNLDCGYLFRVQENNKLLAVYGILPFLIPESHQSAAMLLITQINYDLLIGNLEMDVNDGEIRYKHAIDVEAVGIDNDIIEHLLQSVIAMTTVANEIFSDLINNQNPAEDLPTLLTELRQQSDSRTFFLPTQFVQ
ncbi:YbjN domain-containing protein [Psychrobacter aquimaris]|uniref:YbjN domain-containing protein n=1 Tax=Psychrobacter aquimaris TaxID=292733 RepID=UPI0018DF913D|nr:YbjN domain-containing protein [Psychrobacter aquimaris]